jgi:cob(I)alamin adenosyltransferase
MKETGEISMKQKGLILIYTGNGKGKTTSALGLTLRAIGRGMNVRFLQFIKSKERTYGEALALKKLGVTMEQLGIGFTWTKTPEEHREALKKGWEIAKQAIQDSTVDVVVLDELNNALSITQFPVEDVIPLDEVINVIQNRPKHMHVVITGRNAKQELIDIADLVSTIEPTKHYYNEGIPAVKGLEF